VFFHDELTFQIKAIKNRRRISTRITSFVKDFGKKKETPKEEKTEEEANAPATEAAKAEEGAEAPQLAAPIATEPIEPIVIDEKVSCSATRSCRVR
jgi:hypothetical protein